MSTLYKNLKNVSICSREEINNGILNTANAMPQKDSTSDNQSSFSIARKSYQEHYKMSSGINTIKLATFGYAGYGNTPRRLPTVFDGTSSKNQKQWYGNRDASEIARRRRVRAIGVGSLNTSGQSLSFESHANVNTVNHALNRVRGGGAVAPPKKNHNVSNAYTPTPKTIIWNQPQRISNMVKMPPVKTSFNF